MARRCTGVKSSTRALRFVNLLKVQLVDRFVAHMLHGEFPHRGKLKAVSFIPDGEEIRAKPSVLVGPTFVKNQSEALTRSRSMGLNQQYSNDPHLWVSICRRVPSEAHDLTMIPFPMPLLRIFPAMALVRARGTPKVAFQAVAPLFFAFAGMELLSVGGDFG